MWGQGLAGASRTRQVALVLDGAGRSGSTTSGPLAHRSCPTPSLLLSPIGFSLHQLLQVTVASPSTRPSERQAITRWLTVRCVRRSVGVSERQTRSCSCECFRGGKDKLDSFSIHFDDLVVVDARRFRV